MLFLWLLLAGRIFAGERGTPELTIHVKQVTIGIESITPNGFQLVYTILPKAIQVSDPQLLLTIMPLDHYDETMDPMEEVIVQENTIIPPFQLPTDQDTHVVEIIAPFTPGETYLIWVVYGSSGEMNVYGPGRITAPGPSRRPTKTPSRDPTKNPSRFPSHDPTPQDPTQAPSMIDHDIVAYVQEGVICQERVIWFHWMSQTECWQECLREDSCNGCVRNADEIIERCNSERCHMDDVNIFATFHQCTLIPHQPSSYVAYRRFENPQVPSATPSISPSPCEPLQADKLCPAEGNHMRDILHSMTSEYCEQSCNDLWENGVDSCCEFFYHGEEPRCVHHVGNSGLTPSKPDHLAMSITGEGSLRSGYECTRGEEQRLLMPESECRYRCNGHARSHSVAVGCCAYHSSTGECAYFPGILPQDSHGTENILYAGLCSHHSVETAFPTPALLYPGRLTPSGSIFEEFWCSNHTCYWNNSMKGIEWDYYTEHPLDCEMCSERCKLDPNCGGVECEGYCAWWKVGVCEDPAEWNGVHPTCRRNSNFNKVGNGLCAPQSTMTEYGAIDNVDSVEACFLQCKAVQGCSGVTVSTVGPIKCQPIHDVPHDTAEYDFDWFRDAHFECYARPGDPSEWLIPTLAPTPEEMYTGTHSPSTAPSRYIFPSTNPVRHDYKQWWDLNVVIVISGIPDDFTCSDVKQRIWNAAMVIFVAMRVASDDIVVEGCNMRRLLDDYQLQKKQHITLRIKVHEDDIRQEVYHELSSPLFAHSLQSNIHPLKVEEISESQTRTATVEIPEREPLDEQWRMVLFLLFGVLAGTTCFACYLWLCVKRRAYRRLRAMLRRRQLARRRSQRERSRRSASSRGRDPPPNPPGRRPPPLHQSEDPENEPPSPQRGGSVVSSEDEFEERPISSDVELRVPDPTEAGDASDDDDANL